tara:strand:+ start:2160 stop:2609 length:450 start_codon:yes stop_codon:yes gene_type:complete
MATTPLEKFQMQQEEDGTWTVFDSATSPGREGRMIAGVSEKRALQYVEHLNAVFRSALPALPAAGLKLMREDQIPDFVRDVVATGCDIRAVGEDHYVVGDADLSVEAYEAAEPELDRIWKEYGDHSQLKLEIITYLHSIGRSYPEPPRH